MENRLLSAVVLSFLVLFVWYTFIFPAKKVSLHKNVQNEVSGLSIKEETKNFPEFKEKNETISNQKIELKFSNKGGNLKEIRILPDGDILPINGFLGNALTNDKEFVLESRSENYLKYTYRSGESFLFREFSLSADPTILKVKISGNLENTRIDAYKLDPKIIGEQSKTSDFHKEKSLYEYVINSQKRLFRCAKAYTFSSEKNDILIEGKNNWVGFRNRYYAAILKPNFDVRNTQAEVLGKETLGIFWGVSRETSSKNFEYSAMVYVGPEDKTTLMAIGNNFSQIKRFYNWNLFEWPAKFIYYLLHTIHGFIPSWGICIILISLLVYFSTYPLTFKSMTSMRKMQKIQPEIMALREQYKNDPQKMNAEMMAIYHRHNINPLSGCLPMLLQMPVFVGLYQVLWRDVSFKGQPFLWIKDLSLPDRFFVLTQNIPLIGNEINILPVLMIGIMFVQQLLTIKNAVTTDENQIMQQKIMMYVMPIFLGVIFYKFSSGLTLYFVVFYLMSTLTQWKMLKDADK